MRHCLGVSVAVWLLVFPPGASAANTVDVIEQHLQAGTLAAGETALLDLLQTNPKDDQARFGLGAIQFLRGIERASQSLYRHGALQRGLLRAQFLGGLAIGHNPDPEPISYDQWRRILETFAADLIRSEATLAQVQSADVKLPIHFGLIRLDLDGDGTAAESERFWQIYLELNRNVAGITEEASKQFVIGFDRGDCIWLQGYCHLMLAATDFYLAYDMRELFERTGHIVFPKMESPYPFLTEQVDTAQFSWPNIMDIISYIHLLNFPLAEPERMASSHAHLKRVIALSRQSWEAIQAETDDHQEWVPNAKQQGVIPGVRVSQEMINTWHAFLDESELILDGQKLIPFWRGKVERGVNLKRFFLEPKPLDVVLWIQGTGAASYLENGPLTDPEVWLRQQRVFGGQFLGFAAWFN